MIIIMKETRYNNRELDHFLGDMKEQLNRIEQQTTLHNGRMKTNELNIATINTKINTTIAVGSILLPMVLGLGGYIFFQELQAIKTSITYTQATINFTQATIPGIVGQALDEREFEVVE